MSDETVQTLFRRIAILEERTATISAQIHSLQEQMDHAKRSLQALEALTQEDEPQENRDENGDSPINALFTKLDTIETELRKLTKSGRAN
jgi:chaperonin cofactor prefoldin